MTDEQKEIVNKGLVNAWKKSMNYFMSDDMNKDCFTCIYGNVTKDLKIDCQIKKVDIPDNPITFSFAGCCDNFKSVYIQVE